MTLTDWLKKIPSLSQPIRCEIKTNRNFLTWVFRRWALASWTCVEIWSAHLILSVHSDWPERLLLFWFWVIQKTVRWSMLATMMLFFISSYKRTCVPWKVCPASIFFLFVCVHSYFLLDKLFIRWNISLLLMMISIPTAR